MTSVDDSRGGDLRSAPPGHRDPERPNDDNPYIKLDGPTRRLFNDSELEPLSGMLRHSLANEVVNGYINEALRALPEHWIRKAGVYLPELGSPLRYLAIGPTGAYIITPTNGHWTRAGLLELEHAAQVVDRLLPRHDFSPTRVRLVFAPAHPRLRPQVFGDPRRPTHLADQSRRAACAPADPRRRGPVPRRPKSAVHGAGCEAAGDQLWHATVAGDQRHG